MTEIYVRRYTVIPMHVINIYPATYNQQTFPHFVAGNLKVLRHMSCFFIVLVVRIISYLLELPCVMDTLRPKSH